MFQMVAGVIAVALACIMAIMAIYYGGTTYTDQSGKAMYSKLMNEGEQIQAAVQLYSGLNGYYPTGTSQQILNSLVNDNFLTQIPPGNWILQQDKLVRQIDTNSQCVTLNIAAGLDPSTLPASYNGCPPCSDPTYAAWPSCSSTTPY